MSLKRQLLLVSLLVLILPWAGCQFIRETESALREGQQQMLAGTARAVAESLAQYGDEFPSANNSDFMIGDQIYGHPLTTTPEIDGYFDDWLLDEASLRELPGADGLIRYVVGVRDTHVYLYVRVADRSPVYADAASVVPNTGAPQADRVRLVSADPPYVEEYLSFAAEAPGSIVPVLKTDYGFAPEPAVRAFWQDVPGGYQLEARIPARLLGTHLGLEVQNTTSREATGVRSRSFASRSPGRFVAVSPALTGIASELSQPGLRLIVTDAAGWRIATAGDVSTAAAPPATVVSTWLRLAYNAFVESGTEARLAEPDPGGREQRSYIAAALNGRIEPAWFRSPATGRAVVAVAAPVTANGVIVGAVVVQRGTEAILSLTNETLARLMNVTLIAMLAVAAALLGYATLLSRRIRRLSVAAEKALESDDLHTALPSALAGDEIGDLSRSFSYVLGQLGDYNEYLRTLASKLSHELRTPLAIVTSSLENLEHEKLDEAALGYTARARDGAERLRKILSAMGEASRVEEIMKNAEPETFDLRRVVSATVDAYRDAWPDRKFSFAAVNDNFSVMGSPELVIQLLDKLVDNAVSFSSAGDEIGIALSVDRESRAVPHCRLDVTNPGPPLPERMRGQLFDSMVSVRPGKDNKHLGLGLYVARLIADGHGGRIEADNIESGVRFSVFLPCTG